MYSFLFAHDVFVFMGCTCKEETLFFYLFYCFLFHMCYIDY